MLTTLHVALQAQCCAGTAVTCAVQCPAGGMAVVCVHVSMRGRPARAFASRQRAGWVSSAALETARAAACAGPLPDALYAFAPGPLWPAEHGTASVRGSSEACAFAIALLRCTDSATLARLLASVAHLQLFSFLLGTLLLFKAPVSGRAVSEPWVCESWLQMLPKRCRSTEGSS